MNLDMKYNSDAIVASILAAIDKISGTYHSDFYIGITNNIERRLSEHNVDANDCIKIMEATNKDEAEMAETTLIHCGLKGGTGGGTDDTNFVYCYRIIDNTNP